jgi:copper transport protein
LVRAGDKGQALGRFSSLAISMVALLILSGLALGWLQMGDPLAVFGTDWGVILAVKLAGVAGLLALALRNRLVLTPALATGARGAAPRMARAIRAEIVLALMIVILASSLRLVPPPRALTAPTEPILMHLHHPRAMADIRITTESRGQIMLTMAFQTGDFDPLVPRGVTLTLALQGDGIEPLRTGATLGPDGLWQAGPLTLPRPGAWEVTLRVLITDFESVTLRENVLIAD